MTVNAPLSKVDLNPKPRIININRYAFYLICGVVFMIVSVLAYSVVNSGKVKSPKTDFITQNNIDSADTTQLWFNNLPEIQSNQIDHNKEDPLESLDTVVDINTVKKRSESLHAALESSIKISNIGNTPSSINLASRNSLPLAINEYGGVSNTIQNDPNMQNEKSAFLQSLSQKTNTDYLHEIVKKPLSPYEIKAGTIIPAVMAGGINSDLPGQAIALVSQNIYDSVTGQYILIPQGAKLLLQYDSRLAYGQMRLLVAAKRIIFPNGNSLNLEGMPASDTSGYAGLYDEVDNHYARVFGSSAIMGLITGGFSLSQPSPSSDTLNPTLSQTMSSALGQQMGQVTLGMMNKNLDIQPTIKIRPGYEFNVTVTSDLVFPGYYRN